MTRMMMGMVLIRNLVSRINKSFDRMLEKCKKTWAVKMTNTTGYGEDAMQINVLMPPSLTTRMQHAWWKTVVGCYRW